MKNFKLFLTALFIVLIYTICSNSGYSLVPDAHAQYEPPPPPPPGIPPPPPPPPPPPGSFYQFLPVAGCNGNTPQIFIDWTYYTGAVNYEIWYFRAGNTGYDDNNIYTGGPTTQYTITGLVPGQQYGFLIVALNSSYQAIGYSDDWSQNKYGTWITFPDCSPPGAFQFNAAPIAYCESLNNSRISFNWSPSANATYYTVHAQSNLRGWQPIASTSGTAFTYNVPNPIPAGEGWEFTVRAYNAYSSTPINGGSSYYAYGGLWTTASQCNGPGPFTWQAAPAPTCIGNDSYMLITWWPSANATSYVLTPQTTNTAKGNNPAGSGWMQPINLGNPGNQPGGYKAYYYQIPGVVVANSEGWEFTLLAQNALGGTGTTGGSSYYHYSWRTALNCLPIPTITFTVTTPSGTYPAQGLPVLTRQNSVVTLNWNITNATSANAYTTPAGVASYWNGALGSFSGSQVVNTSTPNTTTFYLTGTNTTGTSSPVGIQLTVEQYPKPYIQTTGGDVHTNETIYITPNAAP